MKPHHYCFLFALILFIGCHNLTVPNDPKQDMQPQITLTVKNFRTAFTGTYTTDATMGISNGTKMQYIVTAINPKGGVMEIDLNLPDIGKNLKVTGNKDASGNVPEQLSIATDGASAIFDTYVGQGRTFNVIATAVNFNSQSTTLNFTVKVDHNPPAISQFVFDKDPITGDDGTYIKVGQSIHINYAVTDCNGCSILIQATEGQYLSPQNFVSIHANHLPTPSGRILVHPTHPYSTYTLTCFSPYGTAAPAILHQQWNAVAQQPPAGMTFYYLVHDGSACWTQSVVANDAAAGESAIRGGTTDVLSISNVDYADFVNPDACPL